MDIYKYTYIYTYFIFIYTYTHLHIYARQRLRNVCAHVLSCLAAYIYIYTHVKSTSEYVNTHAQMHVDSECFACHHTTTKLPKPAQISERKQTAPTGRRPTKGSSNCISTLGPPDKPSKPTPGEPA